MNNQKHLAKTPCLPTRKCACHGDIITLLANAVTPPKYNSRAENMATNRLKAGTTNTSIAWNNLHKETQALVLGESVVVCQAIKQTENEIKDFTSTN